MNSNGSQEWGIKTEAAMAFFFLYRRESKVQFVSGFTSTLPRSTAFPSFKDGYDPVANWEAAG